MNHGKALSVPLFMRGLYWLSWLNLLGAAVLLAAVFSFGADWPQALEQLWEAL